MSQEHGGVPKSKCSKNKMGACQKNKNKNQPKRAPNSQNWNNLSNKTVQY